MTNCSYTNGGIDNNCSLIAYDKNNGGFVSIGKFFTASGGSYSDNNGAGKIEDLKIGKKVDDATLNQIREDYSQMRATVANWLTAKNYSDVEAVLLSGVQDDIATITTAFENHNAGLMQLL